MTSPFPQFKDSTALKLSKEPAGFSSGSAGSSIAGSGGAENAAENESQIHHNALNLHENVVVFNRILEPKMRLQSEYIEAHSMPNGLGSGGADIHLPVEYESLHPAEKRAVREAYVERQGGRCHHCGELLSGQPPKRITSKAINWRRFPPNFRKWPIHLHHSHETGLTIGAVHSYCNAVLWQYHGE